MKATGVALWNTWQVLVHHGPTHCVANYSDLLTTPITCTCIIYEVFLAWLLFLDCLDTLSGGDKPLQNVSKYLPIDTASYPRRCWPLFPNFLMFKCKVILLFYSLFFLTENNFVLCLLLLGGKGNGTCCMCLCLYHNFRWGEAYTWTNVNCCVHNIIVGKLWMEQYGTMEVINHSTG
jgi:hypothetical protein